MRRLAILLVSGTLALGACSDQPVEPQAQPAPTMLASSSSGSAMKAGTRYVVLGRAGVGVDALASTAAASGATVTNRLDDLDIVFVDATAAQAARLAAAAGVEAVALDHVVRFTPPTSVVEMDGSGTPVEAAHGLAASEPYAVFQWAIDALQAPEAWAAGFTGAGVRVAILDGGLFDGHGDLAANIDAAASTSFTTGAWNTDTGTFWHGTHVAGIVAADDNGYGGIGIAPDATLIGVKVLHDGSGSFGGIIQGIYYASTPQSMGGAGADVLNMSLGVYGGIDTRDKAFKKDIADLLKAVDRATSYAHKQGAVVVAAMGNDALDYGANDHLAAVPADNQHVLGVSSTGPTNWALGSTDFATPASYSSFGLNDVDLSAPGGDFDGGSAAGCQVSFFITACYVFDGYFSTSRTGWAWAQGTSMASPAAAGVAALVVQALGGDAPPSLVEQRLRAGALPLGGGNDAFYGAGWVNAYRSVMGG